MIVLTRTRTTSRPSTARCATPATPCTATGSRRSATSAMRSRRSIPDMLLVFVGQVRCEPRPVMKIRAAVRPRSAGADRARQRRRGNDRGGDAARRAGRGVARATAASAGGRDAASCAHSGSSARSIRRSPRRASTAAAEVVHGGLGRCDRAREEGIVVDANPAWLELFGFPDADELTGQPLDGRVRCRGACGASRARWSPACRASGPITTAGQRAAERWLGGAAGDRARRRRIRRRAVRAHVRRRAAEAAAAVQEIEQDSRTRCGAIRRRACCSGASSSRS